MNSKPFYEYLIIIWHIFENLLLTITKYLSERPVKVRIHDIYFSRKQIRR